MSFMRIAPPVHLTEEDRDWLTKTIKSTLAPKRLSERCFVVLLAANGKRNDQIAQKLKIARQKAARWRSRFLQFGRAGIESDEPGRGRKHTYTPETRRLIVRMTTQETPKAATHWSRQTMAKELGVSPSTIGRVWREHGLKPHLARTFKVSNDPRFAEKSKMSLVCISTRRSTRSSSAATRRAKCRLWIARSQVCP